ncbi:DUF2797 domain-containing protein [Candidatus Shikimatogenerans silvanidophilus]|uniref:DUF2797 domain-containing protein n=1 Tax=Candidatus Shikimatogenerans silvanidophilus TaxID=2782547 RepID=UPI001BA58981|nr:DUF2797 domain-containing protein [Candidatus Shikimatogenerans silvanidophilus]
MEFLLKKMKVKYKNTIQYYKKIKKKFFNLNNIIGKNISIIHIEYECYFCKRNKIIYKLGLCKNCFFIKFNKNIFFPEKSPKNISNLKKSFLFKPHIVYLSITSNLKIGVTIENNLINRLIDQGSLISIPIFKTPNRYLSGIIEVFFKKFFNDKTNFRLMIKNKNYEEKLLLKHKKELLIKKKKLV